MEKFKLNGIRIFITKNKYELINYAINKNTILIALNAEKIINSKQNLISIINNNIGYIDGSGTVLAAKLKGYKKAKKIPGCELWLDIIEKYHPYKSFYLIGSKKIVIEKVVEKLIHKYPSIDIKGYRDGFIKDENEKKGLISNIKKMSPDIVFVAMGSPKQEILMDEFSKEYSALYMGLGGSFDIYAGEKQRAPLIYRRLGLEWLFRLIKEPLRIKRYSFFFKFIRKLLYGF